MTKRTLSQSTDKPDMLLEIHPLMDAVERERMSSNETAALGVPAAGLLCRSILETTSKAQHYAV